MSHFKRFLWNFPEEGAHRKSGVASLRTFWCGMGGLKLEIFVDVCVHKKGAKMKDLHTIWGRYHALILFFVDLTHGEPRCMCKIEDFDRVSFHETGISFLAMVVHKLHASQQTWSGFSPTTVPDNNRRSGLSPMTVPEMSTGWSLYYNKV